MCSNTESTHQDASADERPDAYLTVIVVSFNTRLHTLNCLESVFRETRDVSFEVLVVDNHSSDGSADAIREAFPQVKLYALDENLGFAAANNLAGRRSKGRFLLLLNPDTIVLDRAIENLMRYACEHPGAGILGGRTVFADGSLNPTSCWGAPTTWSLFCNAFCLSTLFRRNAFFDPESLGKWPRDTAREVDIVTGCLLLIEKSLWDSLGGFDEKFFMYGEDADLNMRAKRLGYPSRITPSATVVHLGGASEPVKEDKLVRLLTAQTLLIQSHWAPLQIRIGLRLQLLGVWIRALSSKVLKWLHASELSTEARIWEAVWQRRREWTSAPADPED